MTLFVLILIMALERVTVKSRKFHVATLAQQYFEFVRGFGIGNPRCSSTTVIVVALIPAVLIAALLWWLPLVFDFALMLVVLWICLGCPVTRNTYKRFLQAADREDFQACSLYSISFGNYGGDLDKVGQQLVLVNYRQYVSAILFFVVTGLPGLVFYSLVKEFSLIQKREEERHEDVTAADSLLFYLDWIPVRVTAFGFMIVGHFSNAFSAWAHVMTSPKMNAYDALASVSKAAEDNIDCESPVSETLILVQLVKRNVVFILMAVAVATMVGLVG